MSDSVGSEPYLASPRLVLMMGRPIELVSASTLRLCHTAIATERGASSYRAHSTRKKRQRYMQYRKQR